jgi:hypothetical protein
LLLFRFLYSTKIKMAVVAAEAIGELAEGAEGEEAGEKGFSEDSESNAKQQGVDPVAIIQGALGIASSVLSLVTAIKKGKEQAEDIKDRRYAAGVLTKDENRNSLVNKGLVPAYYAVSNIIKLINTGVMPYGWNPIVASSQGFASEVQAFLLRQRRSNVAAARDADLKRKLTAARIQAAADKSNRDAKTQLVVNKIKSSVIG